MRVEVELSFDIGVSSCIIVEMGKNQFKLISFRFDDGKILSQNNTLQITPHTNSTDTPLGILIFNEIFCLIL